MPKMNYQSKPKKIDPELKERFLSQSEINIKSNGLPIIFRINFWLNISLQILLYVGISVIAIFAINFQVGAILLFLMLCAIFTYWMAFLIFSKRVNSKAADNFYEIHQEIYKKHFDKYFDNVKPLGRQLNNPAMAMAKVNRPVGIPNDATQVKVKPTFAFKVDNAEVMINHFEWYWKRSSGKSNDSYYIPTMAVYINNVESDKFKGFNMRILKNTILSRNNTKLENESFDKNWVHHTNDEVKLRMLLTPLSQERMSEDRFFTHSRGQFSLMVQDGAMGFCKLEKQVPFDLSPSRKVKVNYATSGLEFKRSVGRSLFQDLEEDIEVVQKYLTKLYTFKNLLR